MTNYYIYYKADPAKREDLQRAVAELFDTVKQETGLSGTWMQRRDDPATFMEVFAGVRDDAAFDALLARESERLQFAQFLQAGASRRAERFVCA